MKPETCAIGALIFALAWSAFFAYWVLKPDSEDGAVVEAPARPQPAVAAPAAPADG